MKNKILIKFFILFCVFFLVIFFTNKVFASSFTASNQKTYNLPEFTEEMKKYDKYLIFVENGGKLFNLYFLVDEDGFFYNNDSGVYTHGRLLLCSYSVTSDSYYNLRYEVQSGTNVKFGRKISSSSVFICNNDIYTDCDKSNIFYKSTDHYSINLSTNNTTNAPLIAYSNYFNYSDARKYECYISTDAKSWTLMNYETFNDTVNNIIKFRFNYKIYKNGCYYFKFLNKETNEDYYLSYNVTNIVKNSSNSGFTESGIPQPFCTYERVNDEFVIKTQSFSADDMQKFRCFYTKSPGDNYSSWDEMSMGSLNNTLTGETEYYFFFTVPKDSEDCTYYFVFYDSNLGEYGAPSSMNCYFDKMNEYADSLNPTVTEKNNRFTELLNYFKERFGFLTYPFEFLINFAKRIFNINYSDPVIHIPELREPFNNDIIFNGLDFNFNSLLNNDTFSYIYNIYLVAVDFIIVVLFIFLCKKEIEEVFGNG